jgi:hypothetical protein
MANLPSYGSLGEERVAEAAGAWGLPDFVFQPIEVSKGGARREVGDRLVWVGHQVVIVSVKTRSSPQDFVVAQNTCPMWPDTPESRFGNCLEANAAGVITSLKIHPRTTRWHFAGSPMNSAPMSILRKRQKRALTCDFSLWGRLDSNQRPNGL